MSRDQDLLDPPPPKLMPAAVLIPLVPCADGLGVILTVRSRELHRHRGQIAFPGGRIDAGDASARAAALREAWEEIGLSSSLVDVLGDLPWHETGSGYRVRPVVGLLDAPLRLEGLSLQRAEVGEVFIVPLSFLMNPVHHQRRLGRWVQGDRPVTRVFYSMPWQSPSGREYFIWGATASMLRNLYHFLAAD
ncbi:MAG: CoA pyrophosphatase [Lautropia sp.]|nr:CoA pyrophosphatase [Lautropia sp.]